MKNRIVVALAALLIGGAAAAEEWAEQRASEQQQIVKDIRDKFPDKNAGETAPKGGRDQYKETPAMVVIDDWAYLEMPEGLGQSLRTLACCGAPKHVAIIGGVHVEASQNLIKMPYDVIVTVSKDGRNREEAMSDADKKALRTLGAFLDKGGHLRGSYLKIEVPALTDYIKALTLYPRQEGFGFAVRRDQ